MNTTTFSKPGRAGGLRPRPPLIAAFFLAAGVGLLAGPDPVWQNLSSRSSGLPTPPGGSTQQTGAVTGDFDGDSVDEFVLSFRQKPPALVWYRGAAAGWEAWVIEKEYLTIEAGGAVYDIDGDGDLDIVFGGDAQSPDVWWWENPAPRFDRDTPWKRRLIKTGGRTQHHDQIFGDFLGTGRQQLAYWNQRAQTLYLAEIPGDPRSAGPWPSVEVASGVKAGSTPYTEGMSAFDVDADGKVDLLAYDSWFRHAGGGQFQQVKFAEEGGLLFAGYFKPSKFPQIVVSPGDGTGRIRLYECNGDPRNPADWAGRDLIGREVIHGHSLQLGDVNRDGHLDIMAAEMAKWREREPGRDHPEATAWILYGDGQGGFTKTEVVVGHGWHEARLADFDGDGDLDLLNKPYNWDTPRVDVWLNNGTRASRRGSGTSRAFQGPVGLQLYSLREIFGRNVPLGLQTARSLGFREVELSTTYGLPASQYRVMLDRAGLRPVSTILDFNQFADNIDQVVADARTLGVSFVGTAGIPHQGTLTEAEARKAVEVFNRAGEILARNGLRFFYHNHGFEFVPYGEGSLFDLIIRETRPEHVSFEMDVFWTVHPGQDPVKVLQKYPGRFSLMHVKDMRRGTKTGLLTGREDVRNDVALGSGQIDIPAVLKAAQDAGVRHFFIEDESPSVLSQIPQSVRFLESLAW